MTFKPAALIAALLVGFFAGRVSDGISLPDVLPNIVRHDPAPIPGDGLRALVLIETEDQDKPNVFNSVPVRQYIDSKGGELRVWDDDLTDEELARAPADWREGYRKAKASPGFKTPCVAVTNGKTGGIEAVPATPDEAIAVLKKWWEVKN